jgi:hypothetical protein
MTIYNGVENSRITVDEEVSVNGIAAGGATVKDAGSLHVAGVISGPLTVEGGGFASLAGVTSGPVAVEAGGIIDVTGMLTGPVDTNDGELRAAVGSVIHSKTLNSDGDFVAAGGSVSINSESPRFRLVGTGTRLSVVKPD